MPFIKVKINKEITPQQELMMKQGFGKAIELIPGKSEEYLLLEFESNPHFWLRGITQYPSSISKRPYSALNRTLAIPPSQSRSLIL